MILSHSFSLLPHRDYMQTVTGTGASADVMDSHEEDAMELAPASSDTDSQHDREKEITEEDLALEILAMDLVTPDLFATKKIKKEKAEAEARRRAAAMEAETIAKNRLHEHLE
jgi:hypothetical protein